MAKKISSLILTYHHQEIPRQVDWYTVEQITDSIEFHPGQDLSTREVQALCASPSYKVTVKRGMVES